ncbi:MAG: glucose-6-phosphate dehydrogenase assembly protein OpcA [Candidatus Dormibacteraceae bacterium]
MSGAVVPEPDVAWRGEGVSMKQVLAALSNIRRKFALAEVSETELPHPRNSIMTLLAIASTDAEERRAQRAVRAIGNHHPAQVIVVRDQPELRSGLIDATITTDTLRPQLGCAMQCELITLRVRGAAGEHLSGLVDPLLQSGVPNYLWWVGTPTFGKRELGDVLKLCDALFVDSARFEAPYRSFLEMTKLVSHSHQSLGAGDLQWARLEPWRESIAQFFAPPDRRPFLKGIAEVGVDYSGEGRGNRAAAALLIGWMATALGWKLQKAAGGAGGTVVAHLAAEGWRPVQVAFRSVPRIHLAPGEIAAVRVGGAAAGRTFNLSVMRDPDRGRAVRPDIGDGAYRTVHHSGGEDEAGVEIAQRKVEWHRDVLRESSDQLHHTATGDLPGDGRPKPPGVVVRERRRPDSSRVLVTLIEIGDAGTLRHVQQVEPEDEATLLLEILSHGTQDKVFGRSLIAAAELMRAI